ncbi:coiled-coil domain-containing protein R3HCC1L [Ornithorhynchus anatinus]|nr:coiled-coil domain-containing protein R3HCC1L [Ornithorhynchus anatinus]XP_039767537.1 coiled-coil domain-containing protein R3HCC1L [Ornithorhynchus anatinus]
MQPETEKSRSRSRKPDMALYVPKARRGAAPQKPGDTEGSGRHPEPVTPKDREESHLLKGEVFGDISDRQRPDPDPGTLRHPAGEGTKPSAKPRRQTLLSDRNRERVRTQKKAIKPKEALTKEVQQRHLNPDIVCNALVQGSFKPKQEEYKETDTSDMAGQQLIPLSQPECDPREAPSESFWPPGKQELNGLNPKDRDLSSIRPDSKLSERARGTQPPVEPGGFSCVAEPERAIAPPRLSSVPGIMQESPSGPPEWADGLSRSVGGHPQRVVDDQENADDVTQPYAGSDPESAGDVTGRTYLSGTSDISNHRGVCRVAATGGDVTDQAGMVNELDGADGISEPARVTGRSENENGIGDGSFGSCKPENAGGRAGEAYTSRESEQGVPSCVGDPDGASDRTYVGNTCGPVDGIATQENSSLDSSEGCRVTTSAAPFSLSRSLERGDDPPGGSACTPGTSEEMASGLLASAGKLTEDSSDCSSSVHGSKIRDRDCDSLDSTVGLPNGAGEEQASDGTDGIPRSLRKPRTGGDFQIRKEGDSVETERVTSRSDRGTASPEVPVGLEATRSSASDGSAVTEESSWDALFNDDGDCLDPRLLEELSGSVKSRKSIQEPRFDYYNYEAPELDLSDCELPHVIEIYDFPQDFRTEDLLRVFCSYQKKGFDIKWVDDTHALGVFSSPITARDALGSRYTMVKIRPLSQATRAAKAKARACAEFLQPAKERPETSAALARRLVVNALGVRSKQTKAERDAERKKLQEARERKRLEAKQREDVWEGRDPAAD